MERYAKFVIKRRKGITVLFIVIAAICVFLSTGVRVNYNLAAYLPESAQSTKALEIMGEEFTQPIPNTSVMVRDVSIPEALAYKEQLAAIDGVTSVMWLDDVVDVLAPLELADTATVEAYYRSGHALFSIAVEEGKEASATEAIRAIIGEENAISGQTPETSALQSATTSEVINAALILVPIIILILLVSTQSWIEPLLFLGAIGVSILINMGTNLFLGEISFVTSSVSPILQLAVSLDYAIFLLHRFDDYRKETGDPEEAMRLAMKKSVKAVAASAATTFFGFIALMFMDFGIGADLGFNLAKGIVLSFISCMVFLPALTLCCYKLIDKTHHRQLMPSFRGVGKWLTRISAPLLVVVLILSIPSFLAQSHTSFTYGNVETNPESRIMQDREAIEGTFGVANNMVLLVPRGDIAKEYALATELSSMDHVTSVMSYATTVGIAIPPDVLDDSITDTFYSDRYARIILNTNTETEGAVAFAVVEAVESKAGEYYGDTFYTAGQSANLYDMKKVVDVDNTRVNLIAIIAIFLVLLVSMRSLTLPFILLFTIEAGIWINLAIPYFMGQSINFLGYLVISTVQLGATVDYAILLTSYYLDNRKLMPQKEAIRQSLGEAFKSILVSAATLSIAGFTLMLTSSKPLIAELGLLLGRGTIFSVIMVLCMLPALLRLLDKPIEKTTLRAQFFHASEKTPKTSEKGENP